MEVQAEKDATELRSDVTDGKDILEPSSSPELSSVEYVIDPAEEKAVLRKIDWIIMPAMTFVYFFQCK